MTTAAALNMAEATLTAGTARSRRVLIDATAIAYAIRDIAPHLERAGITYRAITPLAEWKWLPEHATRSRTQRFVRLGIRGYDFNDPAWPDEDSFRASVPAVVASEYEVDFF